MAANLRLGRKVSAHILCLPCCSLAPPSAAHLAVISVIYILKPEIYFPGQKARVRWHHHHLIWAWVLMPMAETNKAHYPFLLTPGGCTVTSAILGARKWEWEMFSHNVSLFPWPQGRLCCWVGVGTRPGLSHQGPALAGADTRLIWALGTPGL